MAWQLKLYGQGIPKSDAIVIAKSSRQRPPGWILRLYKEIGNFNYDICLPEAKRFIGAYMRKGFGKKKS